jgi:hypothetical protein
MSCAHITQNWIGTSFTDGETVVCGLCLPRDGKGHAEGGWRQFSFSDAEAERWAQDTASFAEAWGFADRLRSALGCRRD